jgi:serine/threonine-protein kinase
MSTDPLLGKQFGSYELVQLLGRGGMAAVYRGFQASIDRSVAVKVLPAELLYDPNFGTRFTNEARTLAKLNHPAILPLYDFGEANGMPFIVMPLMTRGTLADRLKGGPLPLSEVVRIATPVAQALEYANSQGVLHRDVKPNNILFDQHDNPYLSDFGIAKVMESNTNLTGTGIIGTPDYMSPEQARGDALDHRADLYSLGVVVYQCLTGQQLFRATTPMGVIFKHVSEAPRPLRELRPDLPPEVEAVVLKALAKDPTQRYATAAEFARALSTAVASAPLEAPPAGTVLNSQPETEPASRGLGWLPTESETAPATGSSGMPLTAAGSGSLPTGASFTVPPASTATPPAATKRPPWLWIGLGAAAVLLVSCGLCAVLFGGTIMSAANATPAPGSAIFTDDFDSDDGTWETVTLADGEGVSLAYDGGEYVTRVEKANWFMWGMADQDFSAAKYEVTARVTGANDVGLGLICNYVDDANFYYGGISPDGFYAIVRTQNDDDLFLTDATNNQWLSSDLIAIDQASYALALECANGELKLTVDGVQLAAVQDETFTGGRTGVFVRTFDNQPGEVRFDDFRVTRP